MNLVDAFNTATGVYDHNQTVITTGVNLFHTGKTVHAVYKHVKTAGKVAETAENLAQKTGFLAKLKGGAGNVTQKLAKASPTLTAIGTVYSIYNIGHSVAVEKGHFLDHNRDGGTRLGHKGQRLVGSTIAATPSLAVSGMQLFTTSATTTTAVAEGATLTGASVFGTAMTAGAPLIVAGATWAINRDVQTAIETTRLYEGVDAKFVPGKHQVRHANTAPLARKYDNLLPAAGMLSKYLQDSNLTHALARHKDGSIIHIGDLDLTQAKNRRELRRVFNMAIEADQKVIDHNSSWVPVWLRHGSDVSAEYAAKMDKHMLESAEAELGLLAAEANKQKKAAKPPAPGGRKPH